MRLLAGALLAATACGGSPMQTRDAGERDAPVDAFVPLEDIHLIGRFDAMQRFAWPGTQIRTRFEGTTISVDLDDSGNNFFDVTIDGATTTIHPASGRHEIVLATGLAPGTHDLVLARRTESFIGITTFHGFTGATLVPTPRPRRLVEFIGDSITCGYGVLGASASCAFSADTEAETHAWGNFAATALDAAHVAIAYSGIGMYRNSDGNTASPMPARYGRTLADDPASTWDFGYTPDAIVINLGTNDFAQGDPGAPFVLAYTDFVRMLRGKFPTAPILLATSPMLGGTAHTTHRGYLDQVVATLGDAKISVVEIATQLAADGLGCDYHPSEATQHKMADQLVPALRAATGW